MRGVEWEIAEKRTRFVRLDERKSVFGEIVGDIALAADELSVVLEWRSEILAPMTGSEAIVFVEAARVGMIRPLAAVVPFAERASGVARGLEALSDGAFTGVQSLLSGGHTAHATARMITAREKLGARRRAHGADIKAFEQRALAGQRINVGRPQVRVSVEAQVAPALVVGEDDDEVGLRGFFGGDRVTAPTDHD